MTDDAESVVQEYAYDPFGRTAEDSGSIDDPHRYLGRSGIRDEGGDLLYIRARYFDCNQQRFVSKDSYRGQDTLSKALNRYTYALNNPIVLVDLSGYVATEVVQPISAQQVPSNASWFVKSLLEFPLSHAMSTPTVAGLHTNSDPFDRLKRVLGERVGLSHMKEAWATLAVEEAAEGAVKGAVIALRNLEATSRVGSLDPLLGAYAGRTMATIDQSFTFLTFGLQANEELARQGVYNPGSFSSLGNLDEYTWDDWSNALRDGFGSISAISISTVVAPTKLVGVDLTVTGEDINAGVEAYVDTVHSLSDKGERLIGKGVSYFRDRF
jgi:RHS repeat-associated protein